MDCSQQQPSQPVSFEIKIPEFKTMKRFKLTVASACLGLLFLTAWPSPAWQADSHGGPTQAKSAPDVLTPQSRRKAAPDFTLTDATGRPLKLSSYKGKVVLLDFWATWCGGCKLEIPWYIEFDEKYRDKGLAVIGVSMDEEGMKAVKPFLAEKKIDYAVVIGNEELASRYGLTQMPMTLLIDRDGKIAVSHTGVVNKESFESNIQALLK
jgi:cytochrome c biogenesis protein CcmG/thiol:disulfide interchange protein DsbE